MFDLAISKDGKFVADSSDNAFALTSTTAAYLLQKIRIILRTFLGEWFLDTTLGLPYWDAFKKGSNLGTLQSAMKEAILDIDGVSSIDTFTLAYSGSMRQLTVTFKVTGDDGSTVSGTEET